MKVDTLANGVKVWDLEQNTSQDEMISRRCCFLPSTGYVNSFLETSTTSDLERNESKHLRGLTIVLDNYSMQLSCKESACVTENQVVGESRNIYPPRRTIRMRREVPESPSISGAKS